MPAREKLINSQGQPTYGLFPDGVEDINYQDFDLRTVMDRKISGWRKRLAFNQFQFISLIPH